ncbi:MAG: hypothetical protein SFU55_11085 [Methylophilus sp.]|nr:hypothetical protein [Methylophilus sp.]
MAKALIKVDVRSPASLQATLESQHAYLSSHGGLRYFIYIDNNKRNIGYVIFEWISLRSLNRFLESSEANKIFKDWPVVEIIEVLELYDITEDINKE